MTPRVLIRTEGGPGIGLGHVQRCLALAAALGRLGARCVFVTNGDASVARRLRSADMPSCSLDGMPAGGPEDRQATLSIAQTHGCDVIIVDSYRFTTAYLAAMAEMGGVVVAIDDLAQEVFSCQFVVNGGAQAERLPYRAASDGTQFLLGTSYALLRPSFWDLKVRTIHPDVRRLLITVGGSDPTGLTARLLTAVDALEADCEVIAVIGPFFSTQNALESAMRSARHRIRVAEAPDSLRSLMEEADVAVAGGGQTVYELAATGTPTVSLALWDNQAASLQAMVERGAVAFGGRLADADLNGQVCRAVRALIADETARRQMSQVGQQLVDGQGAMRVARSVMRLA